MAIPLRIRRAKSIMTRGATTRWVLLALAAVATTAVVALAQDATSPAPGSPRSTGLTGSTGSAASPASGAHPAAVVPDRLPDTYSIYSVLMPGQVFVDLDSGEPWAISDTTVSDDDINPKFAPEATLQAPSDNVRAFREAVNDYNQRKQERLSLKRHFDLQRPYVLLTAAQTEAFKESRTSVETGSSAQSEYGGYIGVTFFSEAYFNSTQTAALVYILDWCGNLCSQSEWVYLEKKDGAWIRRSGKDYIQR